MYYFLFCFIFSLPLFIIAVDWVRWIHIHMAFILVILGTELENDDYFEHSQINLKDFKSYLLPFLFITDCIFAFFNPAFDFKRYFIHY